MVRVAAASATAPLRETPYHRDAVHGGHDSCEYRFCASSTAPPRDLGLPGRVDL